MIQEKKVKLLTLSIFFSMMTFLISGCGKSDEDISKEKLNAACESYLALSDEEFVRNVLAGPFEEPWNSISINFEVASQLQPSNTALSGINKMVDQMSSDMSGVQAFRGIDDTKVANLAENITASYSVVRIWCESQK